LFIIIIIIIIIIRKLGSKFQ